MAWHDNVNKSSKSKKESYIQIVMEKNPHKMALSKHENLDSGCASPLAWGLVTQVQ